MKSTAAFKLSLTIATWLNCVRSVSRVGVRNMENLPAVDIDVGKFKYVLIRVQEGDNERYLVRGYTWGAFHADIFEGTEEKELYPLKKQGAKIKWECTGGGRILHKPDAKSIKVYGYSQGFGRAKHSIATDLIKQKYPDYTNIDWSDEGY